MNSIKQTIKNVPAQETIMFVDIFTIVQTNMNVETFTLVSHAGITFYLVHNF